MYRRRFLAAAISALFPTPALPLPMPQLSGRAIAFRFQPTIGQCQAWSEALHSASMTGTGYVQILHAVCDHEEQLRGVDSSEVYDGPRFKGELGRYNDTPIRLDPYTTMPDYKERGDQ